MTIMGPLLALLLGSRRLSYHVFSNSLDVDSFKHSMSWKDGVHKNMLSDKHHCLAVTNQVMADEPVTFSVPVTCSTIQS